jgi:hypothetical protein
MRRQWTGWNPVGTALALVGLAAVIAGTAWAQGAPGSGQDTVARTSMHLNVQGREVVLDRSIDNGVEKIDLRIDGKAYSPASMEEANRILASEGLPSLDAGGIGPGTGSPDATGVQRAALGVHLAPVPAAVQAHLGLKDGEGAMVRSVVPGSPAEKAGVSQYDVVLAVADPDQPPRTVDARSLAESIASRKPGDAVDLHIIQAGAPSTVRVTLAEATGLSFGQGAPFGFGWDGSMFDPDGMRSRFEEFWKAFEQHQGSRPGPPALPPTGPTL